MKTIYCIGELLIDFVAVKQGNELSKATEFTKKAGGAPAGVACMIGKLRGKSQFISAVGNDPFGVFLLNVLKENKVDITLVQRLKTFTTIAFVSIGEDGERDFVFSRGADKNLKYDSQIKRDLKANMIHFGAATGFLGGGLEESYDRYLFDALTQNAFISFDPNFKEDLWKEETETFIKKSLRFIEKSHLCCLSKKEIRLISGEQDLETACNVIHEIGCPIICVTQGNEGALVSTLNKKTAIGRIAVNTVDTTGAGDAFMGCLLYQIANLGDPNSIETKYDQLLEMVSIANKAGALTTTGYGAISPLPDYDAVFEK